MDNKTIDPQAIIQKLAVKIANVEVRNSMLETALESAQAELAKFKSTST